MVSVGVIGYGSYLPKRRVTTQEIVDEINNHSDNQSPERQTNIEWLTERTGIQERTRADLSRESAPIMAAIAAERALRDAGINFSDLDSIIVAHNITDPLIIPHMAPRVQYLMTDKDEEIRPISTKDVNMGCTGGISAIEDGFMKVHYRLQRKIPSYVLAIAVDTLSNITNRSDRESAHILADGAGAAVIGPVEKGGIKHIFTRGDGSEGYHIACTGYGANKLSRFKMNGKRVHGFVLEKAVPAIEELLEQSGYKMEDLKKTVFIPHQMNLRSIDAFLERLEKSPHNPSRFMPKFVYKEGIVNYGNTSAASPLIGLDETYRRGIIKSGDLIMPVAFGGGLTWGGFLEEAHRQAPEVFRPYDLNEQEKRLDELNERYNSWKKKLPGIVL